MYSPKSHHRGWVVEVRWAKRNGLTVERAARNPVSGQCERPTWLFGLSCEYSIPGRAHRPWLPGEARAPKLASDRAGHTLREYARRGEDGRHDQAGSVYLRSLAVVQIANIKAA